MGPQALMTGIFLHDGTRPNPMNSQQFIPSDQRKSGGSNIAVLVLIALIIVFSIWTLIR